MPDIALPQSRDNTSASSTGIRAVQMSKLLVVIDKVFMQRHPWQQLVVHAVNLCRKTPSPHDFALRDVDPENHVTTGTGNYADVPIDGEYGVQIAKPVVADEVRIRLIEEDTINVCLGRLHDVQEMFKAKHQPPAHETGMRNAV